MSTDTTLRNARSTIENAIVDTLAWAYGRRGVTLADIPSLRAKLSAPLPDRALVFVTGGGTPQTSGYAWMFQRFATNADDGVNYVQPTDVTSGKPGRWVRQSSTGVTSQVQTGYAARCELYNDDGNDLEAFSERLFGAAPAFLLSFDGISRDPKSTEPGALDWCTARFTLFAVSFNPRGQQTARQGDPDDQTTDPGTAAMLGDAKTALKGVNLGINDVAYVRIEDELPLIRDMARSRFVETLGVTVYYTETLPDPTLVQLGDYGFNVNYQLADTNQVGGLDTSNDVTSAGLQFPLGDGLSKTFAGGTMNFNGAPLTVPGGSRTFTASTVTYRDVDARGNVYYTETQAGDQPPAVPAGHVRLGVTVTDATGVRLDRLLAAQLIPIGPTDEINVPISSIAITPTSITLATGTDFIFTAVATYADGTTADVTTQVAWASDSGNTTVSQDGLAHTTSPGTAHITASLGGVTSNTATVTAT